MPNDSPRSSDTPPNIIVVLTDNQRLDTISMLGRTACQTPTWDRIARAGAFCDNVRTTSPICSPARASIFTGYQPQQAGMPTIGFLYNKLDGGTGALSINKPPIAHHLRQAGYDTSFTGKWHLGPDNAEQYHDRTAATAHDNHDYTQWCLDQGIPDGFVFHDPKRSAPYRSKLEPHMSVPQPGVLDIPEDKEHNRWTLEQATADLDQRDASKPLYSVLSFEGPHPPLIVPQHYYDMYDPASIPEPDNWAMNDACPNFLPDSYFARVRNAWGRDFDAWRKSIAVYWGYVTYIDHLIQEYLDACAARGLLDNALVVLLSDHGEMLGQHGLWQKMCPYDEALRVPMAMSWPGVIDPNTRLSMDASLIDVTPTLLAAAGIDPAPLQMEGTNLLPHLTGSTSESKLEPTSEAEPRDIFCQYNKAPAQEAWQGVENWRCIKRGPWKYVYHADGQVELFKLDRDPGERHNLAGQPATKNTQQMLADRLDAWGQRTGDPLLSDKMETASS